MVDFDVCKSDCQVNGWLPSPKNDARFLSSLLYDWINVRKVAW